MIIKIVKVIYFCLSSINKFQNHDKLLNKNKVTYFPCYSKIRPYIPRLWFILRMFIIKPNIQLQFFINQF